MGTLFLSADGAFSIFSNVEKPRVLGIYVLKFVIKDMYINFIFIFNRLIKTNFKFSI